MNGKHTPASAGMPGVATLIMIFAVLCISVLAAITLSSAHLNNKSAKNALQSMTESYEAESLAEEQLAGLRRLGETGTQTVNIPVSGSRQYRITAVLEEDGFIITERGMVNTEEWSGDDSLLLWSGITGGK